jgi:DNA-nicking Smr family endonuclease
VSDDLKDWIEFKNAISLSKAIEKCKGIQSFNLNKKKTPVVLESTPELPFHQNLAREIILDDTRYVERNTLKKLSTGKLPIDISVDLHGYTVDDAYDIFYKTLSLALSQGLKSMLVITGKGDKDQYTIRNQLMHWVNIPKISSNILHITHANQNKGGEGAFYFLLRRRGNGGSGRS